MPKQFIRLSAITLIVFTAVNTSFAETVQQAESNTLEMKRVEQKAQTFRANMASQRHATTGMKESQAENNIHAQHTIQKNAREINVTPKMMVNAIQDENPDIIKESQNVIHENNHSVEDLDQSGCP